MIATRNDIHHHRSIKHFGRNSNHLVHRLQKDDDLPQQQQSAYKVPGMDVTKPGVDPKKRKRDSDVSLHSITCIYS